MYHNPTVLLYYAEARHADDLRRHPGAGQIGRAPVPRPSRRPFVRWFASLRPPQVETATVPVSRRPA